MVDFEKNQKLVVYVLNKMNIPKTDPYYDDMLQEGYVGLFKACERYDEDRDSTFSTFAYWYIKGHIMRWYREFKNKPIKISRRTYDTANHYRNTGSFEETAKALGISVEKVMDAVIAYNNANNIDSLNRKIALVDSEVELQDIISNPNTPDELENIYYVEAMSTLNEKERAVIQYKLEGYKQREIAEMLNISQSYVSRVYGSCIDKLREYYESEGVTFGESRNSCL